MNKSADGFELHSGMIVYLPGVYSGGYEINQVVNGTAWCLGGRGGDKMPFDCSSLYVSHRAAAESHAALLESNSDQAALHARRARNYANNLPLSYT